MPYIASISTPGYLPEGDPEEFDTAAEAWAWLASERRRDEDDLPGIPVDPADPNGPCTYSETVLELERHAEATMVDGDSWARPGTVYGPTPGRGEDTHDLGLAYCVTWEEDEDEDEDYPLL